jgi:hypothetical protein
MRLGSLMEAASATVPERISGRAKVACSAARMMSAGQRHLQPAAKADAVDRADHRLVHMRSSCSPPKPPTCRNRRPPRRRHWRPSDPSRGRRTCRRHRSGWRRADPGCRGNRVNTSPMIRLVARSTALALGRSSVTSSTWPTIRVLTGPVMDQHSFFMLQALSFEADQRIDGDGIAHAGDQRIDFEFEQTVGVAVSA